MMLRRAAFAGLMCCTALANAAQAQELTEAELAEAMDFAMHDAAFTIYHEIGHLLVGELSLPVLGKEEDAADALAAILLLEAAADDVEAFNTLIDSADGWYFNAVQSTGEGVDALSYYDEHSLDIQRAYALVCMMVGADPENFGETADIYEMDPEQQEACGYTYQQAFDSWGTVLEQHTVETAGPGSTISVIYEDAGDFGDFAGELQDRQILEWAAQMIESSYSLPRPITFRATLCDEANAYYLPEEGEVRYCYELAAEMFDLYLTSVYGAEEGE